MKRTLIAGIIFFSFLLSSPQAAERATVYFTSDLHSHLTGHSPEVRRAGGLANLAWILEEEKKVRKTPSLLLDGGDFLMGTLFHTISSREALELSLMKRIGYEAIALGNHEFDFRPSGLATIIRKAKERDALVPLLLANIRFHPTDPNDDVLEMLASQEVIKPFLVIEKGGLKFGVYALMGLDAAASAPFASPVTFTDPLPQAHWLTKYLKEVKAAELVILLFHGGIKEAVEIARKVRNIDLIIVAHSHTVLLSPIFVGQTPLVAAGKYGEYLGVVELAREAQGFSVKDYGLKKVAESKGRIRWIEAEITRAKETINRQFLHPFGLRYDEVVASSLFNLIPKKGESNLGNLITDALLWYVNRHLPVPEERVVAYFQSNGVIRDGLGKGYLTVADAFRSLPLGRGSDGTYGYSITSCYLYAEEIKKILEINTTLAPWKGDDYFLQISGLRFNYHPYRLPFDRVGEVWLEGKPLDYSSRNRRLYRIATNLYNAAFLKVVSDLSYGLLKIIPKDREGKPLRKLEPLRADGGELKEWLGFIEYLRNQKDENQDGIPDIPARYREVEGRGREVKDITGKNFLGGGPLTPFVVFSFFSVFILAMTFILRRIHGRKDGKGIKGNHGPADEPPRCQPGG